jgi:hypothetical protein
VKLVWWNRRGCVGNVEEGIARAEEIGFPVMIKASEGEYGYPPFVYLFTGIFLKLFFF